MVGPDRRNPAVEIAERYILIRRGFYIKPQKYEHLNESLAILQITRLATVISSIPPERQIAIFMAVYSRNRSNGINEPFPTREDGAHGYGEPSIDFRIPSREEQLLRRTHEEGTVLFTRLIEVPEESQWSTVDVVRMIRDGSVEEFVRCGRVGQQRALQDNDTTENTRLDEEGHQGAEGTSRWKEGSYQDKAAKGKEERG